MRTEVAAAIGGVFETMSFCEVSDCGARPIETPALGASLSFRGALSGEFRFAISERTAARLSLDFLAAEGSECSVEQKQCIVAEFANVACGAVLSAVAPGADIHFSVPQPLRPPLDTSQLTYHFSTGGDTSDVAIGIILSPVD